MTGLAKPGETGGVTGPGLVRQQSAGRVFGRVWNPTDRFLRFQNRTGPIANTMQT